MICLFIFRERLHRQIYTLDYPLQKTKNNLYEVVSLISGPGRPETYWKKYFPLLYKAHHVSKDQQLSRQLQHLGRKVCSQRLGFIKQIFMASLVEIW